MADTYWGETPEILTVSASPTPTSTHFTVSSATNLLDQQYFLAKVAGVLQRGQITGISGNALTVTGLTGAPDTPGEVQNSRELIKTSMLVAGALFGADSAADLCLVDTTRARRGLKYLLFDTGKVYYWDPLSTAADDGDTVLSRADGSTSKTLFLHTGTTSWTVPSDWHNASNTVRTLGAGAKGSSQDGGKGGAYSEKSGLTLTPGASLTVAIGNGASGNGNTYLNGASLGASQVGAQGGASGGSSASGVGTVKFSGGTGGSADGGSYLAGAGGGGAAGPHGDGGDGGSGTVVATVGCGGGGADGGADGGGIDTAPAFTGATGGNNRHGTGGGIFDDTNPSDGGGGGGGNDDFSFADPGQDGADGEVLWTQTSDSATAGPGGGGGGGGGGGIGIDNNGGKGGAYGGGGGGRAGSGTAGNGGNGLIAITYNPPLAGSGRWIRIPLQ